MAFFELNSDITIGNFRFSGVHEVRIKKSIHSYADSAVIKIPAICKVKKSNGISDYQTTGNLINDRDPVAISLGYNGLMMQEFRGFVKRRTLGMPLEVECEGYVQVMRLDIDVSGYFEKIMASELLKKITMLPDGTPSGITIQTGNDIPLLNVSLTHNNGIEICDFIKRVSQGALNIFFITPSVLWCGLTYSPYAGSTDPLGLGSVSYNLGFNCIRDNNLKEVTPTEQVQIIFNSVAPTGVKQQVLSAAGKKTQQQKGVSVLNNIGDVPTMLALANEKMYKKNYAGYTGQINGFLQPYCAPGWKATVIDNQYKERNGDYLVESTEVIFGVNGARRKAEIGPKVGFSI